MARGGMIILGCLLALPLTVGARPQVVIRKGSMPGTTELHIKNAYRRDGRSSNVRLNVPTGVARELARRASNGGLRLATAATDYLGGANVRLIAGQGENTMILDRTRCSNWRDPTAGQGGSRNTLRVQYGMGEGARAFWFGRTRPTQRVGDSGYRGPSSVFRTGSSTVVDPATLLPVEASQVQSSQLHWFMKPAKRTITTNPTATLQGFGYRLGEIKEHPAPTPVKLSGSL